jgi:hypothetical protein
MKYMDTFTLLANLHLHLILGQYKRFSYIYTA